MKVTFIQPYFENIWESLGIGYIIAYCKKHMDGFVKFDFLHENYNTFSEIVLSCIDSDVVAISATTPTYERALMFAAAIKKVNSDIMIVLGGWHPTAAGAVSVDEVNSIDKVIAGEGEVAFLDILNGDKHIFLTGNTRKLSFDELPWPDRDIIQQDRQINHCQHTFGERMISIQSIRGCKMNCVMCSESCMTGEYHEKLNPLRLRDPVDTVDELDYLKKVFVPDRFKFVDPTWSVSEDFVFAFCEEKLKRGNKLKWEALVHVSFITEKSIEIMAKANCDVMMIGCESGSQKILDDMNKGITVSQIEQVFNWGKKYGIKCRSFFMIGMPNEDLEAVYLTYKMIKTIEPDIFGMTFFTPYPGTKLYDAEKFKDVDWSKCNIYDNDFWESNHFTNKELKGIQQWFHRTFKDILVDHKRTA